MGPLGGVLRRQYRVVVGVLGVEEVPHHVVGEVDRGVVEEEQPADALLDVVVDGVVHHPHALVEHEVGLHHELGLGQHAGLEGVDLLGHALGVVEADALEVVGQVGAGALGQRDRGGRVAGVDVDGRGVDLDLGLDAAQVEAHDARHRAAAGHVVQVHRQHLEAHGDEGAPVTRLQDHHLVLDLDRAGPHLAVEHDLHGHGGVDRPRIAVLLEHVLGPDQAGVDEPLDALVQRHQLAPVDRGLGRRVGGVEGVLAVGRIERRRHHPGEGQALGRLDREIGGHAPDVGRHVGLGQDLPEARAGAVGVGRPAQGELPVPPQADDVGRGDRGGGGGRHTGHRIAVDEVEDAVPAGVAAGDEVRPGHRRLGWDGGAQRVHPAAVLHQSGEVAHPIGIARDGLGQQVGVHPVDAQDDHLLEGLLGGRAGQGEPREAGHPEGQERPGVRLAHFATTSSLSAGSGRPSGSGAGTKSGLPCM